MPTSEEVPNEIHAVIDTNAMLDIASCHDVSQSIEKDDDIESQGNVYRRHRARDGVILAMLFDRDSIATFNLAMEAQKLFLDRVDPKANGSLETIFTTTFFHFTKDVILPRWNMGTDLTKYTTAFRNEADDALVEVAQQQNVPLISNEGFGPNGATKAKIVGKAQRAGVTLLTPRQYFTGKIDEDEASNDFMLRFLANREEYVRSHPSPEIMRDYFGNFLTGYYRHILYGVTEGFEKPVAVRVPDAAR